MNLCVMISWLYWRHFQSLDLKVKEKQMGKISAKDKIITHILYLVWYSQVLLAQLFLSCSLSLIE